MRDRKVARESLQVKSSQAGNQLSRLTNVSSMRLLYRYRSCIVFWQSRNAEMNVHLC